MDLVSIVIPVFNRENVLRETLDSVSSQTYKNWECLIIDDGSDDNSLGIMEFYSNNDNRFIIHKRPSYKKKGASSCRNIGLENAKGKFIQFLDSDDIISSNKIENQVKDFKSLNITNSIGICAWGKFHTIENLQENLKIGLKSYKCFSEGYELMNSFGINNEFLPLHSYLIPKGTIQLAGMWNEELTNNDDGEYITRILLNSRKVFFSNKCLVYYRTNENFSLSNLNNDDKIISLINSWKIIEGSIKRIKGEVGSYYVENAKLFIVKQLMGKGKYKLLIKNFVFLFRYRIFKINNN